MSSFAQQSPNGPLPHAHAHARAREIIEEFRLGTAVGKRRGPVLSQRTSLAPRHLIAFGQRVLLSHEMTRINAVPVSALAQRPPDVRYSSESGHPPVAAGRTIKCH